MSAPSVENVTQVSSMPIPPMHYVKLYTDEAIKRGTAPKYVHHKIQGVPKMAITKYRVSQNCPSQNTGCPKPVPMSSIESVDIKGHGISCIFIF